jgi:hypothetical protein
MANIYSYNKQVYPSKLYDEIDIGLGIIPSFIDYDITTFDIDIYFEDPLTVGEETALDGIITSHVFIDDTNNASFFEINATKLTVSDIITDDIITNSFSSNSISTTNLSGGTIFSGSTNISNIFSNINHTHPVSAITDIQDFYLKIEDDFIQNVIRVGKSGNVDFTSIKDAVLSISGVSPSNPYIVHVGPGIYIEDTITLQPGVSLISDSLGSVIIIPTSNTNTIINGADASLMSNIILSNADGVGGKAVYYTGQGGTGLLIKDCNFNNNYINVHSEGLTNRTVTYIDRCSVTGNNNRGFVVENVGGITSQIIFVNGTYSDLTPPATTELFSISGSNSTVTITDSTFRVSGTSNSTFVSVYDGGEVRILSSSVRGFNTSVLSNTGDTTPNIILESCSLSDDDISLNIQHTGTTGYFNGVVDINKVILDKETPFYIYNEDLNIIEVAKKGEQFNSIKAAVDFITDSSENNRYIIKVSAGVFEEDEIDLSDKPYVSVVGSSIQTTVVKPKTQNQHIFKLGFNNEISFLTLEGAPSGYSAIYCYDGGNFSQAHKISIYDCDTGIYVESVSQDTIFYGEYIDINGTYTYGTQIIANNGYLCEGNLENYYLFPESDDTQINNYITGDGSIINIITSGIYGNGVTGTTGVYLENGATLKMTSTILDGLYYGVHDGNVGVGSNYELFGISVNNSEGFDIFNEHPNSEIFIQGVLSYDKISRVTENFNWLFLDKEGNDVEITKRLSVTFLDGTNTDISTLLFEGSTMGLYEGGLMSEVSGLTINVSTGFGYLRKNNDIVIKRIEWVDSQILLDDDTNQYIYFNENGILSKSGGKPDTVNNILLGRVITNNGTIEIIETSPLIGVNTSNIYSDLLTQGLGPIYANGSNVTENNTPLRVDITQGEYYFGTNKYSPSGGTEIFFHEYYRDGLSDWITTTGTTIINNTQYDNNGELTGLTTDYYTKHVLYVVGDGDYEKYLLVYGQNQYETLVEVEGADLPSPPNYFNNAVVPIAAIYVQEGNSNIVQIENIKPTVGFRSGGVGSSNVHGNLLGLDNDDHTQYLLVSGTRAMSGNLNMGNNNITSVGTINNVTIQTHASRHLPNGSDPLTTGIPSTIGNTNQEGIQNAFSRQDHIHAHGNQGGGTLHSVVTTSVNGFMSSDDKVYLDSVPSLLNDKANLSGANFTGTITTPTISATTYQGNVITSGTSVGGGQQIFKGVNGNTIEIKTLVAGSNITLTPNTDIITISSTGGGGGSSRELSATTTTNNTPTVIDVIDNITDNTTSIIEVFIKAYSSSASNWGIWKRTLSVTKVSGSLTIRSVNADVDKQSSNLRANSVSFNSISGNIEIIVTGLSANTIEWESAYEIII